MAELVLPIEPLVGTLLGVPRVLPTEKPIVSLTDESAVLVLSLILDGDIQSLPSRFNDGEKENVGILGKFVRTNWETIVELDSGVGDTEDRVWEGE